MILRRTPKTVRAAAFGKLPIEKDFVSLNCAGSAAAAFRHWLEQGFRIFEADPNATSRLGDVRCALLSFVDSKDVVVATLMDSTDKGYLRAFPFSCFTTIARRDLRPTLSEVILQLSPVWAMLRDIMRDLSRSPDLEGFESLLMRSVVPKIDPKSTVADATDAKSLDFLRYIDGPQALDDDNTTDRLNRICAAVASVGRSNADSDVLPGLQFPLSSGSSAVDQSIIWAKFLETNSVQFGSRANYSIVFPHGNVEGRFWAFPRAIKPADFGLLCSPPSGYLSYATSGRGGSVDVDEALSQRLRSQIMRAGASGHDLAEFRI